MGRDRAAPTSSLQDALHADRLHEDLRGIRASKRTDPHPCSVAAVVAATDLEKAERAVEKALERAGVDPTTRSHAKVAYEADNGVAFAFVEDFGVFGTEPEVKRTIDALQGEALAGSERYERALEGLEGDRLAHFYFDTRKLFEFAMKSDPEGAEAMAPLKALIPFDRAAACGRRLHGRRVAPGARPADAFGRIVGALRSRGQVDAVPSTIPGLK